MLRARVYGKYCGQPYRLPEESSCGEATPRTAAASRPSITSGLSSAGWACEDNQPDAIQVGAAGPEVLAEHRRQDPWRHVLPADGGDLHALAIGDQRGEVLEEPEGAVSRGRPLPPGGALLVVRGRRDRVRTDHKGDCREGHQE